MSNFIQPNTYSFPAVALQPGRALLQRIAAWLKCCWEAECRRAEHPDRVVPYY